MTVFIRILAVLLAYLLACIAASTVLTIGTLMPQWNDLTSGQPQAVVVWSVVAVGTAIIAGTAVLPTLLIVVLAEGFAWRSSLVYAALGGVLAFALTSGLDVAGYADAAGSDVMRAREVVAAAGIAGGLVYWLFAGRKAGSWKASRKTSRQTALKS
jgi:hypothetical protein